MIFQEFLWNLIKNCTKIAFYPICFVTLFMKGSKDTKHVTNAFIIVLTLIDICAYVAMREANAASEAEPSAGAIRFSRALRPFLLGTTHKLR